MAGDGRCLDRSGSDMTLQTCDDKDTQIFRRERDQPQNSATFDCLEARNGAERLRKLAISRSCSVFDYIQILNSTMVFRYETMPPQYICLSSDDLFFKPCNEAPSQLNWKYDYLPADKVPARDRFIRVKSGNGQCLEQVTYDAFQLNTCNDQDGQKFRRHRSTTANTLALQNALYLSSLAGRFGEGPLSAMSKTESDIYYEPGTKTIRFFFFKQYCLDAELIFNECGKTTNSTISWDLEIF
ncbi:hypothetical protein BC829DRAFT_394181 [Chytridium lagenaria]|nr:hypothetical protein BC829DRAFT_394181 [Chytridium lagenaria]